MVPIITFMLYDPTTVVALGQSDSGVHMYGGERDDGSYSIIQASDLGFAVAGYTRSFGAGGSDMWLIRTVQKLWGTSTYYQADSWNRTYGGLGDDAAKSIIQASDGGFALAGYTNSSGAGGFDMWLVKVDEYGEPQWNMTCGGELDDAANGLIQTSDGGYLQTGYTNMPNGTAASTWLVKTDASGSMEWNQTYAGLGANAVIANGNSFVCAVQFPDAFGLLRVDSSGQVQLNQTYESTRAFAKAESVIATSDGGYALAGWVADSETGARDGWLLKTDSLGNVLWDKTFSGTGIYSVIETLENGYAMTGDYATLIVIDNSGNVEYSQMYDGLSAETRQSTFTATYSVIEYNPLKFAFVGQQASYGAVKRGFDAIRCETTLKTDTTPPAIQILSPQNGQTYQPDNIPLTFYVDDTASHMWYSLDGFNSTLSGNMTLPTLADGQHTITVYVQDTSHNTNASGPVQFLSQTIMFEVSSKVSAPTTNTTDNSHTQPTLNMETLTWISIIVLAGVIVCMAIIISRKNRSKEIGQ